MTVSDGIKNDEIHPYTPPDMKAIRKARHLCLVLMVLQFVIAPAWIPPGSSDGAVAVKAYNPSQHLSVFELEETENESSFNAIDDKWQLVLYELDITPGDRNQIIDIYKSPPVAGRSLFTLFCALLI